MSLRNMIRTKLAAVSNSTPYNNPNQGYGTFQHFRDLNLQDRNKSTTMDLSPIGMKSPMTGNETETKKAKDSAGTFKNPDMSGVGAPVPEAGVPGQAQHKETSFEDVEKTFASLSNSNQNRKKMGGVYMDRLASIQTGAALERIRQVGEAAIESGNTDKAASAAVLYNAVLAADDIGQEILDKTARLEEIFKMEDQGNVMGVRSKMASSESVSKVMHDVLDSMENEDKNSGAYGVKLKRAAVRAGEYAGHVTGRTVKNRQKALRVLEREAVPNNIGELYTRAEAIQKAVGALADARGSRAAARVGTALGAGIPLAAYGIYGIASPDDAEVNTVEASLRSGLPYMDKTAANRFKREAMFDPEVMDAFNVYQTGKNRPVPMGNKVQLNWWERFRGKSQPQKQLRVDLKNKHSIKAIHGSSMVNPGFKKYADAERGIIAAAGKAAPAVPSAAAKSGIWKFLKGNKGKLGLALGGAAALLGGGKYAMDKYKESKTPWFLRKEGTAGMGAIGGALLGAGFGRMLGGEKGALAGAGLGAMGGGYAGMEYNDSIKNFVRSKFSGSQVYYPYIPYYNDKNAFAGALIKGTYRNIVNKGLPAVSKAAKWFGGKLTGADLAGKTTAFNRALVKESRRFGGGGGFTPINMKKRMLNEFGKYGEPFGWSKPVKDAFKNYNKEWLTTRGVQTGTGLLGTAGVLNAIPYGDKNNSYRVRVPYIYDKTSAQLKEGDGWFDRIRKQLPGIAAGAGALGVGLAMRKPGKVLPHLAGNLPRGGSYAGRMLQAALIPGGAAALGGGLVGLGRYDNSSTLGAVLNAYGNNPLAAGLLAGSLGSGAEALRVKNLMKVAKQAHEAIPKQAPNININNTVLNTAERIARDARRPLVDMGLAGSLDVVPDQIFETGMRNLPTALGVAGAGALAASEFRRPNSWLRDLFGITNRTVLPGSYYPGSVNPLMAGAASGIIGAGAHMIGDYAASGSTPSLKHLGTGLATGGLGVLGGNLYNTYRIDYKNDVRKPRKGSVL